MKKLVIALMGLYMGSAWAQELQPIHLSEAKVKVEKFQNGNTFLIPVTPQEKGEFENDPIGYANKNFDFKEIMKQIDSDEFDSYDFSFKSRKGTLNLFFNKNGELISTRSKFQNIALPHSLQRELLKNHNGWNMVKNTYNYHNVDGKNKENEFRIVLEKGKQRKTINLKPEESDEQIAVMIRNYMQ